jgi:membrane protein YqaA with SNARE-associated domain
MGRDMRPGIPSLFDSFDRPSAIIEPADVCNNGPLYRVIADRLVHLLYAHNSDDWRAFDWMVEKTIIRRIRAGSDCIVATFLGIDEHSHLDGPFHENVETAYRRIDAAIGRIVQELKVEQRYDDTILIVLSDHGHTDTNVHIPVVDLLQGHRFNPFYFPRKYSDKHDSAVMESGNAMAQLYFRRNGVWGEAWNADEMRKDEKIERLIKSLLATEGIPFVVARDGESRITFIGRKGSMKACKLGAEYELTHTGESPLENYPEGRHSRLDLLNLSFEFQYPDAVDQLFRLFESTRVGDLILSADPGYDLRMRHERPEHHGSHGSLHREHMSVPIAISVPTTENLRSTCDVPPTVLRLTGKEIPPEMIGMCRVLRESTAHGSGITSTSLSEDSKSVEGTADSGRSKHLSLVTTVAIIVFGIALTVIFQEDLTDFGTSILQRFGQRRLDEVLFSITAVSSTPLFLPIWGYVPVAVQMGYSVGHLAAVMALGSASGSMVTYMIGRCCGNSKRLRNKYPQIVTHRWMTGQSRRKVSMFLFLGTASPIPCDVFYAACGLKKYPWLPFWTILVSGRIVRYLYLGLGFSFILETLF